MICSTAWAFFNVPFPNLAPKFRTSSFKPQSNDPSPVYLHKAVHTGFNENSVTAENRKGILSQPSIQRNLYCLLPILDSEPEM